MHKSSIDLLLLSSLSFRFAYSNKLNKETDETISTDSVTLTPVEEGAAGDAAAEEDTDSIGSIPIVFPMTIRDERQLFALSRRLASMSNNALASGINAPPVNFNHSFAGTGLSHYPFSNNKPKLSAPALPMPPPPSSGGLHRNAQRTTVDGWPCGNAVRTSPFGFSFSGAIGGGLTPIGEHQEQHLHQPTVSVLTIAEENDDGAAFGESVNGHLAERPFAAKVKRCRSAPQLNKE